MDLPFRRSRRRSRQPSAWSRLVGAAALPGILAAACGGEAGVTVHSVADSAGVEIIQHPANADVPLWRLEDQPRLQVGVVSGDDPEYLFQGVVAALRDEGGGIVVLDRARQRISVFGPDGALVNASGREGGGPGEYISPSALWRLAGDSLAVYDPSIGRVSVLDREARFVRSFQVEPVGTLVLPSGAFGDGRLLVVNAFPDPQEHGMATSFTVSTAGMEPLARFRHIENQTPGPMGSQRQPLIPKVLRMWASGDRLFVVRNLDHELLIQDSQGSLRRIVRWHGSDLAASGEGRRRYIDELVERLPEERRAARRASLDELRPNERFPPFERVHADDSCRAWLQTYRRPFHTGPREWRVVRCTGELAGRIDLPERAVVLDAGEDEVLLLLTDELRVQYVARFGIRAGEGSGG